MNRIKTFNSHCVVLYSRVPTGVGIEATVFSYDTPVFKVDSENGLHRLWSGWSATTQRDINTALPGVGMTKKQWEAMSVED